jgi:hypothetical protein
MLYRILLAAGAILLLPAAATSAGSIVFVKDANVWVASPDGSNLRQLTRDGTADQPYRSPSQADDGTVAASYRDSIRLISRGGTVTRELDPPPLTNSVSHAMDGTPVDVALSPDGKTIACTFVSASCPVGASCGARAATGYITAAGDPLPGNLYLSNPSWAGNSRTLVFGGYLHQVNTHDLGAAEDVHWFDDYEVVGQENSTDLGDGELSAQGDKLALVRSYGSDTHIVWYTGRAARGAGAAVRHGQARGPARADLVARRPVAGLGRAGRRVDQAQRARLRGAAVAGHPRRQRAGLGSRSGGRRREAAAQRAGDEAPGDAVGAVRDRLHRAGQGRAARPDDRVQAHHARRRGHGEADPEAQAPQARRQAHRTGDDHARGWRGDDAREEDQRSVTLTDEMTTGSSGFSVAGSVSATPILSTTS